MRNMKPEQIIRNAIFGKPCEKPEEKTKQVNGVDLFSKDEDKYIEYTDIKSPRKRKSRPDNPADWVTRDFVSYSEMLYKERYKVNWGLNFSGCCQQLMMVRDSVVDIAGFCDNATLLLFIDFFFDNFADRFVAKEKGFYFSQMRYPVVLDTFSSSFEYEHATAHLEQFRAGGDEATFEDKRRQFEQDMRHTAELSLDRFMSEYGIVLSVNWFMLEMDMDRSDAESLACDILKRLAKKSLLPHVKEATEQFNPYPARFPFHDATSLIKRVDQHWFVYVRFDERTKQFEFVGGTSSEDRK
jgi:hypothetical protein